MGNYVLAIDCSSSIKNALPEILNDVENEWIPWRLSQNSPNKLALVAFGNDVHIKKHYSDNLSDLQAKVSGLYSGCCGGYMTSLYDAILVSLVFEDPKPDGITVWTDGNDTRSNATENDYINLANSLGIPIDFPEIPEHWWDQEAVTWYNMYALGELIPLRKAYVSSLEAIASKVELARVVKQPKGFFRKE